MDVGEIPTGRTRETAIRRDALGRWWNGDERIDHKKVARSFDGWIERAEDGRLCLANDINWAYVSIEGPPYFVRAVRWEGERAILVLSGDREEKLDPQTLRASEDGVLYCDVLQGTLAARFDNHAAMQLAERFVPDDAGACLVIDGERFLPPTVTDPLALHPAPLVETG
jgi:uncharacterized protein